MNLLQWSLLGFAVWTLLLLGATVGLYRWIRIFSGSAAINEFPADAPSGEDWYKRATRAHANCIENLPVLGALVFTAWLAGVKGQTADALGLVILCARVCQTVTHVGFTQTARAVAVRFTLFMFQLIAMFWLAVLIATR